MMFILNDITIVGVLAWYTFPALFLMDGSLLGAYL